LEETKVKPTRRLKAILIVAGVALVLVLGGYRAFREVIPTGVARRAWIAYLDWSYDRGTFLSPDHRHSLLIRTNDPGVFRSAHNYTWVMVHDWLWGKYVVAEGYLEWTREDPAPEQIPLVWNPDGSFTITFLSGPNDADNTLCPVTVHLP
jgi:hypothetical protein